MQAKKERHQHNKERVCVCICFLNCLWAQMGHLVSADQRITDRLASKTITTHLRQEEGVRGEREIQMEAAHILENHFQAVFHTEKKPEGESERQRESPQDNINVRN